LPAEPNAGLAQQKCITARPQQTPAPGTRINRIADLEKDAILGAIAQLNGDKLTAARPLGIGKTTLYRKLNQYGELQAC
jgi:transcriptional regulator of acetoin/glycerol metabolism